MYSKKELRDLIEVIDDVLAKLNKYEQVPVMQRASKNIQPFFEAYRAFMAAVSTTDGKHILQGLSDDLPVKEKGPFKEALIRLTADSGYSIGRSPTIKRDLTTIREIFVRTCNVGEADHGVKVPRYNLIMSASTEFWEKEGATFEVSRFLEFTDDDIKARFNLPLSQERIDELMAMPTLFAYEFHNDVPARVGRITELRVRGSSIRIRFEFDPSIPPLAVDQLRQIAWELDLESGAEQSRHHC